jgi:outer membrane immunogenic protein
MKKFPPSLAALLTLTAFVYAGPEPLPSGKEMKEVAPAPAPSCFDWSGFYIGGFGGYKRSNVDPDLTLSGSWNTVPQARDFGEAAGSRDLDNDGGEAGGLIGYNFQRNCWVLGIEADGGYLWARHSHDSGEILAANTSPFHIRSSFQTHYLFTAAPRVGYILGRWLPYVTGGLAVGDLKYEQELAFPGIGVRERRGDHSQTNAGWTIGGGLQYALTSHWAMRAQYQYIDLGDIDFDSQFGTIVGPGLSHHDVELTEHNVSFAIMYKF